MFSCFGSRELTHQTAVPQVPVSISGSDKDFCYCVVVVIVVVVVVVAFFRLLRRPSVRHEILPFISFIIPNIMSSYKGTYLASLTKVLQIIYVTSRCQWQKTPYMWCQGSIQAWCLLRGKSCFIRIWYQCPTVLFMFNHNKRLDLQHKRIHFMLCSILAGLIFSENGYKDVYGGNKIFCTTVLMHQTDKWTY